MEGPDVGTAESAGAGQRLEAARAEDQVYRAQRQAELTHRLRWPIRLLAIARTERLFGYFLVSLMVSLLAGVLLIAAGIVRGDRDHEMFPWEVQLGVVVIIASFAIPIAISAAEDRLRVYLRETFEREGLTFPEQQ